MGDHDLHFRCSYAGIFHLLLIQIVQTKIDAGIPVKLSGDYAKIEKEVPFPASALSVLDRHIETSCLISEREADVLTSFIAFQMLLAKQALKWFVRKIFSVRERLKCSSSIRD